MVAQVSLMPLSGSLTVLGETTSGSRLLLFFLENLSVGAPRWIS